MKVRLERSAIIKLYCFCREAERSLHRACDPANPWAAFRNYYNEAKRHELRAAVQELYALAGDVAHEGATLSASSSVWRAVADRLFAHWKKHWTVSARDLALMLANLERLLEMLTKVQAPDAHELTSLRCNLLDCELFIEDRCPGLPQIKRARDIMHFDKDPRSPSIPLSVLLADAP